MMLLHCSQKLAALEKILMKSFPDSLKVYGSLYHINRGNPFNLEVVVDSWPQFKTVITRPHESEMKDDLDNYTNSYFLFTKDSENLGEMLTNTDAINWKQVLQIQGFQSSVDKVLKEISACKMVKINTAKNILLLREQTVNPLETTKEHTAPETKEEITTTPHIRAKDGQIFRIAPLKECHADQVNQGWGFGGNERSLRYIQRCIRHFPSFSAVDSNGNPVCWGVTEQSTEYRMAYTLPEFRNIGLFTRLLSVITKPPFRILPDAPVISHVAEGNEASKRASIVGGYHIAPCNWWNQWTCHPIRSPL
ncbi:glycine N-phenylacetyltransferase [Microcaecilia unicolor]|uniref:Glycine N-acyltransferase-like protein n=1 Tax=Microcaecilia unicolor TaxID=1415580 RepID=A0A6P7ZJU2_9AMPH|nr:glycine N-phenylacetyltransferase-like [Microcaecilia unicolor]XP_030077730.1 glycine N-phenylacetyltransferase-like [Microcaecilia unicolor]XP_030077738.1 glycine N-phenylacetyltransferase-like [Microcaecilia unicolor]XP_030077748.1 glycine N-phenylacetyltransferase-like [Microcaecilia unicolor]